MKEETKLVKKVDKKEEGQYKNLIKYILENGERVPTPQDIDAITCFGTAPTLVYDLENGDPVITERKMGVKGPIAEMCAFINGEQNVDTMKEKYGLAEAFWGPWVTERKTQKVGAEPRCLGPGSYGRAFSAFPTPDGKEFDQIENVIRMLKDEKLRNRRTIYVTAWIPFYNGWGANQRTVVSPCHGFMHFRYISGRLDLLSWHRAADILLGFPNDMISYIAVLKMICSVTGLTPGKLIFQISDAHIYENQLEVAKEVLAREPRLFPTLKIINPKENIKDFRFEDFQLEGYDPHPSIVVPSAV
jgi:thymidylate synthase